LAPSTPTLIIVPLYSPFAHRTYPPADPVKQSAGRQPRPVPPRRLS
jgi:hypothetical protein